MSVELVHRTDDGDKLIEYIARVSSPKNQKRMEDGEITPGQLIGFLARQGHWSPFEMVSACLAFNTTRAISAQMLRHRSFSFQEFSQRYAKVDTSGFKVPQMRLIAAGGNRQGSGDVVEDLVDIVVDAIDAAYDGYDRLIEEGVAPECARMVLPLCSPTRIYMHGTLRSWHHYFEQRCSEHAQAEHRELALGARKILTTHFPVCAEALGWVTSEVNDE